MMIEMWENSRGLHLHRLQLCLDLSAGTESLVGLDWSAGTESLVGMDWSAGTESLVGLDWEQLYTDSWRRPAQQFPIQPQSHKRNWYSTYPRARQCHPEHTVTEPGRSVTLGCSIACL
jgi:hypothetical protein